ncbi:nucleotide-diphospho-sugar transferase [Neoconidiobolus thromboides FSU 785]|nr:nucleotide-diphospho-sugar transferase [Neoconidiobolus thromboides FSU 785]
MPHSNKFNINNNYKLAYCALLTKESYTPGAHALVISHSQVASKYPLLFLISSEITLETQKKLRLSNPKVIFQQVDLIYPKDKSIESCYAFSHFSEVWTKLQCFSLEQYDYLCCLDCDMLFLKNLDEFLELASNKILHRSKFNYKKEVRFPENTTNLMACHACVCNPMKRKNYPKWWQPMNCAYSNSMNVENRIDVENHWNEVQVDEWNTLLEFPTLKKSYFNTGLFIISPNLQTYQHLYEIVINLNSKNCIYQFPEQDLLNLFFYKSWEALPLSLNFLKTIVISHPELVNLDKVRNLHFIMDKPWNFDFEDEEDLFFELNMKWREVFNNEKKLIQ